ncbi:uncharacterized protein LOC128753301 [Synchiropus splendidus]|uniref:uncharacterized protein LOC128753301 n=1 Tax=Synchiropus splendidus TaxID=270530 RepID=UPI00237DFD00|nr:uncharacterized protein LOC128753301 [Synchiropus splendidus]
MYRAEGSAIHRVDLLASILLACLVQICVSLELPQLAGDTTSSDLDVEHGDSAPDSRLQSEARALGKDRPKLTGFSELQFLGTGTSGRATEADDVFLWSVGNVTQPARSPSTKVRFQRHFPGVKGIQGSVLGPFTEADQTLVDWLATTPVVLCSDDVMFFTASGEGLAHLFVDREGAAPISLLHLPSYCGYSVKSLSEDLQVLAAYDACYIIQENGSYVLPLLWSGSPLKLSCPMEMPTPAPSPSSMAPLVFCSPYGMAVQIYEKEEDILLLGVIVNGDWVPFVSADCAYRINSEPEDFIFFIPFVAPCATVKDEVYIQLVSQQEYILLCPAPPGLVHPPHFPPHHTPELPQAPYQPVQYSQLPQILLHEQQPITSPLPIVVSPPGPQPQPVTQRPIDPSKHPAAESPIIPVPVPEYPSVSQVPSIPETPLAPKVPPIPEYQSASKVPSIPETTSAPMVPSTPRYQPVTQVTSVPEQQPVTQSPSLPEHPSVLQVTSVPEHQPAPQYPVVPQVPYFFGYHSVPQLPYFPEYLSAPQVPYFPEYLPIPQVPYFPELPLHPLVPSFPESPSVPQCQPDKISVFLPFAHPDSIQVTDKENWLYISSVAPHCQYMIQMSQGAGVSFQSPLPACHSYLENSNTVSLPVRFFNVYTEEYLSLDLHCPLISTPPSVSPPTTPPFIVPKPKVSCMSHEMIVELPPGPMSGISVRDVKGNQINLKDASNYCGYSASKGQDGKIHLSLQLQSTCHMNVENARWTGILFSRCPPH